MFVTMKSKHINWEVVMRFQKTLVTFFSFEEHPVPRKLKATNNRTKILMKNPRNLCFLSF